MAADYLAAYAALVGTGSLVWQIYSTKRARRPVAEVKVAFAFMPFPTLQPPHDVREVVTITVINRGDKPVGVRGYGLHLQDDSGRTMVKQHADPWEALPGTVQPHHDGSAYIPRGFVEEQGIDLTKPLRGFANLATGGTIDSKPKRLLAPGSTD